MSTICEASTLSRDRARFQIGRDFLPPSFHFSTPLLSLDERHCNVRADRQGFKNGFGVFFELRLVGIFLLFSFDHPGGVTKRDPNTNEFGVFECSPTAVPVFDGHFMIVQFAYNFPSSCALESNNNRRMFRESRFPRGVGHQVERRMAASDSPYTRVQTWRGCTFDATIACVIEDRARTHRTPHALCAHKCSRTNRCAAFYGVACEECWAILYPSRSRPIRMTGIVPEYAYPWRIPPLVF